MTADAGPEPRADARRNRARVLAAAGAAFAAEGRMVPLGEIARRAGVGAGTVYRHFSSKEELFEAVVAEGIEEFLAEARELTVAEDASTAFFGFLGRVVERASFNRALCDALARDAAERKWRPPDPAPRARREFGEVLGELLVRAQRAGGVRRDVGVADVRLLLAGCAGMEQWCREDDGGTPGLVTAVLCDGLRTEAAVTKTRNGTRGGPGAASNETPRCDVCGAPLRATRTGRPARYCGDACRQKAHRHRAAGTRPGTQA